jgi:hypothetical protein
MTINWKITFKTPFVGNKKSYLLVSDLSKTSSGWQELGSVSIPNNIPVAVSITPSSGAFNVNTPYTFTTTVSDPDGYQNLYQCRFLINSYLSGSNCALLFYDRLTNKLYLRNDTNSSWLGGFSPGSANIIENSYVKLNCTLTSVLTSGDTMTINWNITFKTPFVGNKKSYLLVFDLNKGSSGWKELGRVTISPGE